MARETLDLFIKVTENGSEVFKKIGVTAKAMGKDIDSSAKQSEQSLKRVKASATEVGAAFGTVVAGLAKVGQATVTQARQVDGIQRAYGDAADEILAFTEQIQESTIFSNDAARQAALNASSLATNYQLTGEQISEVVTIAANLATVFGTDLADATLRVSGAIRGEGEAAEALGLNMSDAAVAAAAAARGFDEYATSATEAEKAAFRFVLLQEQAAYATGAAGDAAETAAGQSQQFVNQIQDQIQAFGGLLGPVSAGASVLGEYGLATIGASAAIGNMSTVAKAGVQSLQLLRASSALATVALGPVGLALAATTAVVAIGSMTDWFGLASSEADDYADSMQLAADATKALDDTIYAMRNAELGTFLNAEDIQADLESAISWTSKYADEFEKLIAQTAGVANIVGGTDVDPDFLRQVGLTADQVKELGRVTDELAGRLDDTGVASQQLYDDMNALFTSFQNGDISAQQLLKGLIGIETGFNDTYLTINQTTDAVNDLTSAFQDLVGIDLSQFNLDIFLRNIGEAQRQADDGGSFADTLLGWGEAAGEAGRQINGELRTSMEGLTPALLSLKDEALAAAQAQEVLAAETSAVNQNFIEFVGNGENIVDVLQAMAQARADEATAAAGAMDAGRESFAVMLQMREAGEGFVSLGIGWLNIAESIGQTKNVLDQTFDVIIGGTQALGQSGQQVADWASELTGITFDEMSKTFTYELSAIDTALSSGRISQEEYNAAIVAGEDILWNNAIIQRDVAAIQAMQAPLIADRTNAYQDEIAALRLLNPEQQRHALLMMDSGVQAQVATAYSTAYAASLGEIPEDVASELILAEAASNPDLAVLLTELGLIEEGADGTVKVNFPDADSMTETLGTLNETLEDLIAIIAEVNGLTISPNIDPAVSDVLRGFSKPTGGHQYARNEPSGTPLAPGGLSDGSGGPTGSITPPPIPLTLDLQFFNASMSEAEQRLNDTISAEYIATLMGDSSGAVTAAGLAEDAAHQAMDPDYLITITGDGTGGINAAHAAGTAAQITADGDYELIVQGDGTGGINAANDARDAAIEADGTTGTIYIEGDNSGARAAINGVTGYQGEAYVYVRSIPTGQIAPGFYATGGTVTPDMGEYAPLIPSYATGGSHAMVGEHGPEMVWLPNGAQVTNAAATESRTRGNDRSGPPIAVYGTINIYPPNTDVYSAFASAVYAGER